MDKELQIIGWVHSPIKDADQAPKHESEGAPDVVVRVEPIFAQALMGLAEGQEVMVLTWLHKGDRSRLQVHPRGNPDNPLQGVFNTRSPNRPNPLGMHLCRILSIDGTALTIGPLEVIDGTPVVDIKPAYRADGARTTDPTFARDDDPRPQFPSATAAPQTAERDWGEAIPASAAESIRSICHTAWSKGLLAGFNGNVSLRMGNTVVITCTGAAKGDLTPGSLTCLDLDTGKRLAPGRPSSETPMHMDIYDSQPEAWAIVHTHPPHLLALSLKVEPDEMLKLPLFESEFYRAKMIQADALQPGTPALAQAVAKGAATHQAVFMRQHGLMCWGTSLEQALGLTEELEHLAKTQLMSL